MLDLNILIPATISSECSLVKYDGKQYAPVCMSDSALKQIVDDLKVKQTTPAEQLAELKKTTNCETEECVLKEAGHKLGAQRVKQELFTNFKHDGPTDDKLLSNYNIDGVMEQYAAWFPEFLPLNFNMVNYADYCFKDGYVENKPDTLATVSVSMWIGKKKKLGCVINTDVYQGEGKHWMALFVDTTSTPCTVEFFNSSGNAPALQYQRWLEKTKIQLEQEGKKAKTCVVSRLQHQDSRTECGVYSLFYIYARLRGIPLENFVDKKIDDEHMFRFRQLIFKGKKILGDDETFSWSKYQEKVSIKWE